MALILAGEVCLGTTMTAFFPKRFAVYATARPWFPSVAVQNTSRFCFWVNNFVIANKVNGEIISSTNIFKILKKKYQETKIVGFIMGSGKVYSVTLNGFLIVSSASSGKVENFKKIDTTITSSPIIHDGKLFIYTGNSKILGFN